MSLLFTSGAAFFTASYIAIRLLLRLTTLSRPDQSLIAEKCVSSLQAILSTIVGIIVTRTCQNDILHDHSVLVNLYAEFAVSYFIYDYFAMYFTHTAEYDVEEKGFSERPTLYRVLHYIKNNKMMMLHHFLLSGVFFPIILFYRNGLGDFIVGVFYCVEATIPFISLRFILAQLKLKHTPGYIISGLLMILTFFISRICVLPYIYWHYSIYAGIQMYEVPFRLSYYCNLGCLAFLSLQIYWMGLMFRGLYKVVCKIYKMKTKTS